MNIYDVLVNVLERKAIDVMCEKFRLFSGMKELIETPEGFLNSQSISRVINILEDIAIFNLRANSENIENSDGEVTVVEPHIKKDMNDLNLLMVRIAIKELNKTLDNDIKKSISNKLLRVALNEQTPKNVVQLIVDNKNNLLIDSKFIKKYYWLNINTESLKVFEDLLRKNLSYNDMFNVVDDRNNENREKPIGDIWFYTCYLVSKNNEPLKVNDFKNFIEDIEVFLNKNKVNFECTEDLFVTIYKTIENFKKNLDQSINKELALYDLIKHRDNTLPSIYKIFSKDSFTKKECLVVAEYLANKNLSFIEEAFLNMNKEIISGNNVVTGFVFSQLEKLPKIVQIVRKIGIDLTVEDYTSIALISDKDKADIILNFATKENLENNIINSDLKSRTIKF